MIIQNIPINFSYPTKLKHKNKNANTPIETNPVNYANYSFKSNMIQFKGLEAYKTEYKEDNAANSLEQEAINEINKKKLSPGEKINALADEMLYISTADEKDGYGIYDNDIQRAKNKACRAITQDVVKIDGTDREIYATQKQQEIYKNTTIQEIKKNPEHYSTMCRELIMSDAMFLQALALKAEKDYGIKNLSKKPTEKIFRDLKNLYNEECNKKSKSEFCGIGEGYLYNFFERSSSKEKITAKTRDGKELKGADATVHEANKALAKLFENDSEFNAEWKKYCSSDKTAQSYLRLAESYIKDYKEQIGKNDIKTPVNCLEHFVFRSFERDGNACITDDNITSVMDELAEVTKKSGDELKKEKRIKPYGKTEGIKLSNGMILTYEGINNSKDKCFHTLEYGMGDWNDFYYLPQ